MKKLFRFRISLAVIIAVIGVIITATAILKSASRKSDSLLTIPKYDHTGINDAVCVSRSLSLLNSSVLIVLDDKSADSINVGELSKRFTQDGKGRSVQYSWTRKHKKFWPYTVHYTELESDKSLIVHMKKSLTF